MSKTPESNILLEEVPNQSNNQLNYNLVPQDFNLEMSFTPQNSRTIREYALSASTGQSQLISYLQKCGGTQGILNSLGTSLKSGITTSSLQVRVQTFGSVDSSGHSSSKTGNMGILFQLFSPLSLIPLIIHLICQIWLVIIIDDLKVIDKSDALVSCIINIIIVQATFWFMRIMDLIFWPYSSSQSGSNNHSSTSNLNSISSRQGLELSYSVIRNSKSSKIKQGIVVGDIVELSTGQVAPADLLIVQTASEIVVSSSPLKISPLSQSGTENQQQQNTTPILLQGQTIKSGEGKFLVVGLPQVGPTPFSNSSYIKNLKSSALFYDLTIYLILIIAIVCLFIRSIVYNNSSKGSLSTKRFLYFALSGLSSIFTMAILPAYEHLPRIHYIMSSLAMWLASYQGVELKEKETLLKMSSFQVIVLDPSKIEESSLWKMINSLKLSGFQVVYYSTISGAELKKLVKNDDLNIINDSDIMQTSPSMIEGVSIKNESAIYGLIQHLRNGGKSKVATIIANKEDLFLGSISDFTFGCKVASSSSPSIKNSCDCTTNLENISSAIKVSKMYQRTSENSSELYLTSRLTLSILIAFSVVGGMLPVFSSSQLIIVRLFFYFTHLVKL